MSKNTNIKVSDYLSRMIEYSGKTQIEIAKEIGYPNVNMITLFKQAKTKVPVNKVPLLAKSLGIDPVNLLRIVLSEYSPEVWDALEEILGQNLVSAEEKQVLDVVRKVALGLNIAPNTDDERRELAELALKWRQRTEKELEASSRRAHASAKRTSGPFVPAVYENDIDTLLGLKEAKPVEAEAVPEPEEPQPSAE